jgi:hypothetical protein
MDPSNLVYLALILIFFLRRHLRQLYTTEKDYKYFNNLTSYHLADISCIFNGSGSAPLTHVNRPDSAPSFSKHSPLQFRPVLSFDKNLPDRFRPALSFESTHFNGSDPAPSFAMHSPDRFRPVLSFGKHSFLTVHTQCHLPLSTHLDGSDQRHLAVSTHF